MGIHDHPSKKLGARPSDPDRPKLAFVDFLSTVPSHPLVDAAPPLDYPMDLNDRYGTCVVAGADHTLQVVNTLLTGSYVNWTDTQVINYYRTQNPNFPSDDGGMVIQQFLEYLVKVGAILGFAKVDHTNADEVRAAIYLGLAVMCGVTLDVAQQDQIDWRYVSGSAEWGGHCIALVGYDPDQDTVVTWGDLVKAYSGFMAHQCFETWFVVTQAHVDHPEFRNHFDLTGFAAAYKSLTGRDFPVAPPSPTPPPPPGGGDGPFGWWTRLWSFIWNMLHV